MVGRPIWCCVGEVLRGLQRVASRRRVGSDRYRFQEEARATNRFRYIMHCRDIAGWLVVLMTW